MKQSERWKRGLPYVGNKARYMDAILEHTPPAHEFVDVFGGGGSSSLFAADSGKFDIVSYNEIDTGVFTLFSEIISGNLDGFDFRSLGAVTREQFLDALHARPTDADEIVRRQIILLCYSFSNDRQSYLWGRNIEQKRLALARYVLDHTSGTLAESAADMRAIINEHTACGLENFQRVSQVERLVNIERLRGIEQTSTQRVAYDRIITSNADYHVLPIAPDAVVYCDPPYKNAVNKYALGFDFDEFEDWLQTLPNENVFVSSYECPRGCELVEVVGKPRRAIAAKNKKTVEKLYKLKR